ncbi:hypothetical protein RQP46_011165 [Phenoliferia psychrophenolica]
MCDLTQGDIATRRHPEPQQVTTDLPKVWRVKHDDCHGVECRLGVFKIRYRRELKQCRGCCSVGELCCIRLSFAVASTVEPIKPGISKLELVAAVFQLGRPSIQPGALALEHGYYDVRLFIGRPSIPLLVVASTVELIKPDIFKLELVAAVFRIGRSSIQLGPLGLKHCFYDARIFPCQLKPSLIVIASTDELIKPGILKLELVAAVFRIGRSSIQLGPLALKHCFYDARIFPCQLKPSLIVIASTDELIKPGILKLELVAAVFRIGRSSIQLGPLALKHCFYDARIFPCQPKPSLIVVASTVGLITPGICKLELVTAVFRVGCPSIQLIKPRIFKLELVAADFRIGRSSLQLDALALKRGDYLEQGFIGDAHLFTCQPVTLLFVGISAVELLKPAVFKLELPADRDAAILQVECSSIQLGFCGPQHRFLLQQLFGGDVNLIEPPIGTSTFELIDQSILKLECSSDHGVAGVFEVGCSSLQLDWSTFLCIEGLPYFIVFDVCKIECLLRQRVAKAVDIKLTFLKRQEQHDQLIELYEV